LINGRIRGGFSGRRKLPKQRNFAFCSSSSSCSSSLWNFLKHFDEEDEHEDEDEKTLREDFTKCLPLTGEQLKIGL